MKKPRDVVYEKKFDQACAALFRGGAQADEIVLRGVEWTLAREPSFERYEQVASTGRGPVRAIKTRRIGRIPSYIVLFTVEEDTVYLHYIGHADASDGN